jgi:hypothetical protein
MILLREALPDLCEELKRLLLSEGEDALASQVPDLEIVARCPCRDDFCATVYCLQRPAGAWGETLLTILLLPERGDLIIDVVGGRIATIEILFREEIRARLDALLPL